MAFQESSRPTDGINQNGQPFVSGNGGSRNFRIPCILTLDDGTLIAAADARWDAEADNGGMDIIVSRSKDLGKTWQYSFAAYLGDHGNIYHPDSSTLMDPEIVADNHKIYLLADLYPASHSLVSGNLKVGTGFTEDGYLLVRPKDGANYDHYLKGNKIYAPDGTAITQYLVNEWFHITANDSHCGNLFYADAPFVAYPTSYLVLITSEDGGQTWSAPILLHNIKKDSESFFGTGPGRGLCTADGTILFSCYTPESASIIFSKDQGQTWQRFGHIPGTESQAIELADGTIRIFYRNTQLAICYCDAVRKGDSYEIIHTVNTGIPCCSNCMVSAIRLSEKVDGKEAILVSCPTVPETWSGRYNGKILLFTLNEHKEMTLHNTYAINGKDHNKEFFAYSCMTELPNGSVGILYEDSCIQYQGMPQGAGYSRIVYREIPLQEILP